MQITNETIVAVVDGENLKLFKASQSGDQVSLSAMPDVHPSEAHAGSGARHNNSSANPSHGQAEEDDFSASVAKLLNSHVEDGQIKHLFVIAAPKPLGELRKHYSKRTSDVLVGELSKDLANSSLAEIEKAVLAA